MADPVEKKLAQWGTAAADDIDLRTEEGVQAYAVRYAMRKGVTLDEALLKVKEQVAQRGAGAAQKAGARRP